MEREHQPKNSDPIPVQSRQLVSTPNLLSESPRTTQLRQQIKCIRDSEYNTLQRKHLEIPPKQSLQKQAAPNKTGMPDNLKTGIEQLSGIDISDVRVHYNSPKPAQLNAHAYAQGTEIHLSPGQEKHLPHEAWHTVQQKQNRVTPTIETNGVSINDSPALEKEADIMGDKASSI